MLNVHAIVLNGIAKVADLVSDFGLLNIHAFQSGCNVIFSLVLELNWAWVAIVINISPGSFNSLHALISLTVKVNFL
jgi:hypothetical protein